ncbi:ornithine cyclodeaminase [Pseudoalteromonas sp. MMG006]|uniref:ornithine cyclodeaminase n=1 Tax=Pseudoalteromonas sp. MMG006 TaxID=2822683 RepID=UPI001B36AEE0|nr:ornithine cyclodeaminase [Pseudoalteromonas sp. MMG006]MBQ4798761.1 ornithine cyclodeaminase [Pseudoalteromonas sp. MMG006]
MSHFIAQPKQGVPFVSVQTMAKLINKVGIENVLLKLTQRLKHDFARWHEFDKSPRYAAHSPDGVIELMPVSDGKMFSCKYVNGHPKNTFKELQTVAAFGILSDVDSGYPVMISEMCLLTALRTAATSALVAQYLAPKNSTTLTLIGNGAQSEFQALAFKAVLGITHIRLYDIDKNASKKAFNNLSNCGLNVTICNSAKEAVQGAHIITTCTADKKNATILTSDMIPLGVHLNAIGGDCPGKTELDSTLLERANVFVEYEPQTRIEGEIQQMSESFAVTEFHKVINKQSLGRTSQDELTIFDGVGFASEDFTALVFIKDELIASGEFELLDLITQQADPRNLFSVLNTEQSNKSVSQEQVA